VRDATTRTPPRRSAYGRAVDIAVPCLFVVGDHDLSPALAGTSYLIEAVPNAAEARFPDSAHSPSVERPAEFIQVVTAWLNENGL
jgi:3-oxoadipate enol-lactonase